MTIVNDLPVKLGVANSVDIIAHVNSGELSKPLRTVTLSTSYLRNPPPGWVVTPAGAAIGANPLVGASVTIASGTAITVSEPEAAALVAAGAAA